MKWFPKEMNTHKHTSHVICICSVLFTKWVRTWFGCFHLTLWVQWVVSSVRSVNGFTLSFLPHLFGLNYSVWGILHPTFQPWWNVWIIQMDVEDFKLSLLAVEQLHNFLRHDHCNFGSRCGGWKSDVVHSLFVFFGQRRNGFFACVHCCLFKPLEYPQKKSEKMDDCTPWLQHFLLTEPSKRW